MSREFNMEQGRSVVYVIQKPKTPSFYAVAVGRKPGVYKTWEETQEQVKGYSGAIYRRFDSLEEAHVWYEEKIKRVQEEAQREAIPRAPILFSSYEFEIAKNLSKVQELNREQPSGVGSVKASSHTRKEKRTWSQNNSGVTTKKQVPQFETNPTRNWQTEGFEEIVRRDWHATKRFRYEESQNQPPRNNHSSVQVSYKNSWEDEEDSIIRTKKMAREGVEHITERHKKRRREETCSEVVHNHRTALSRTHEDVIYVDTYEEGQVDFNWNALNTQEKSAQGVSSHPDSLTQIIVPSNPRSEKNHSNSCNILVDPLQLDFDLNDNVDRDLDRLDYDLNELDCWTPN
eukprot:TRINITY_DN8202_c0_g1_i8.p1 TRINITY_DN8202_c0_g1~~TRINITY_DN8202_c0_g1_i8.p1  ORF type:complete len:395 (+),score=79.91 TRINITY_DN8202_c0_g1_i8:154-1185(+)